MVDPIPMIRTLRQAMAVILTPIVLMVVGIPGSTQSQFFKVFNWLWSNTSLSVCWTSNFLVVHAWHFKPISTSGIGWSRSCFSGGRPWQDGDFRNCCEVGFLWGQKHVFDFVLLICEKIGYARLIDMSERKYLNNPYCLYPCWLYREYMISSAC